MPYADKKKEQEAKQRYEEKRKAENGTRHRVWTGLFYPDSAPPSDVWESEMSDKHLKIWVSPVHDSDKWTAADEQKDASHKAGTAKKNHHHYVVEYDSQVDKKTFLDDFAFLHGPANVKAVRSLRSMVRYLAHLDDPKKAPYRPEDILTFGGATLDVVNELGSEERHEALRAMRRYIRQNEIRNFCDFVDYCDDCEQSWARLLDDNSSYTIEKYIKSRRYKLLERMRDQAIRDKLKDITSGDDMDLNELQWPGMGESD